METRTITVRGKTIKETRIHLTLNEAASRAAAWMGLTPYRGITGRVEIKPRGRNSPLRTLIILRNGEEISRIGVTEFSKYFVYSEGRSDKKYYVPVKLDENGVHFWERDGDSNWWVLAPYFSL